MSQYLRVRDREESELAKVDVFAHRLFGRDESAWTPADIHIVLGAIATVHADYPRNHPLEVAT